MEPAAADGYRSALVLLCVVPPSRTFAYHPDRSPHAFLADIDPITYAFRALIPEQFYSGVDGAGAPFAILAGPTPICGHTPPGFGEPCTTDGSVAPGGAVILNGVTVFYMDRYAYVSQKYDVWFNEEWTSLGYLAIFIAVFQLLGLYGIKYIRHIVR